MLIELEGEKLDSFLESLDIIKNGCQFLVIKDSRIRLFGNNKSNIFEMDMTSIFNNDKINIAFNNMDQKIKLLYALKKQSNKLYINIDKESRKYIFFNDISKVYVPFVIQEFIERMSPVVSDDEYDKHISIGNLNKITEGVFDDSILKCANIFSRALESKMMRVTITLDKIIFGMAVSDINSPVTTDLITINGVFGPIIGYGQFKLEPIISCNSPIKFILYNTVNNRHLFLKMESSIGKKESLPFVLWGASSFYKENE